MANYSGSGNFSSGGSQAYRLDVSVTTTAVSGGTQLDVSSTATQFNTSGVTPAYSSSGTRGYDVPGGRTSSTSGSLLTSGSANWTYDFGANSTQTVWGGFTRFIADSYGSSTTVTITASGSGSTFLQNASVTVSIPLATTYTYTLNYNANGGSGSTGSTTATSTSTNYNLTAASSGFSRSGYNFTGWNTSSNGGGSSYSPGSSVALSSGSPTLTLYAQWAAITPAPVFSNGVDNYSTVRVGQGFSDYLYASDATSYSLLAAPSGLYVQDYGSYAYIFGSINATTSGTRTIIVRASGPGGTADSSDSFELRQQLPVWQDTTLSNARVGSSYTSGNTFSASGATNWVVSGVPAGLSGSGVSTSTITISGTPTSSGSFTIYATPFNSDGDAGSQVAISLYISPRVPVWVDTTLTTSARVGVSYSSTVSANYVTSWNDGTLPLLGLSFSGTTSATSTGVGTVSGTPTNYGTASFSITPSNSDAENPGATAFSITVVDAALSWSDQTLASSVVTEGNAFSDGVAVQSGPVSVTYSVTPGYSLPPGLSLNSTTGAITGTPTTPDSYVFRVRATNGSSETLDTANLSLTVEAAGGYVRVKGDAGWQDATVFVKTAGGWIESTVNAKSGTGWGASFTN
jgi:uncharacterized repeat protein (TIGR02543 family)